MKRFLRTNLWLLVILILSGIYILCSLNYNNSLLSNKKAITVINDIIVSIFSSSILLLFFEIILFHRDKTRLGYLAGTYTRKKITQVNKNGMRSIDIDVQERLSEEKESNIKFQPDYKYHDLTYYDCDNTKWLITLNYEFGGNYSGIAEYYDHKAGKKPYDFPKPKTIVEFTLTLNSVDRVTGAGNYSYRIGEDYGLYQFQVIGEKKDALLIFHKNVVPSGLAEGYEKWQKEE